MSFRGRSCGKPRYRPPVRMIKLTRERVISRMPGPNQMMSAGDGWVSPPPMSAKRLIAGAEFTRIGSL